MWVLLNEFRNPALLPGSTWWASPSLSTTDPEIPYLPLEEPQGLIAESDTYSLVGTAAILKATFSLVVDPGSYVLSGTASSLEHSVLMSVDSGTYLLTGQDATLVFTPTGGTTHFLAIMGMGG